MRRTAPAHRARALLCALVAFAGVASALDAAPIVTAGVTACTDCAGLPHRYLGRARVKGKAHSVALYEIFEERETGKTATRGAFEQAVRDFESRRWDAARRGFTAVLEQDEGDNAARCYLQRWIALARQAPPRPTDQGRGMNL